MEGHCSTGQSPQWAVVPMEEEGGGGGGGGGGEGEEEEEEDKSPTLESFSIQMSQFHTFMFYVYKINLILCSHICLLLFSLGFSTNIMLTLVISSMRSTRAVHLTVLSLKTIIKVLKTTKLWIL